MSNSSYADAGSQGAASQSLDVARTVIDGRLREADAFRTAEAARRASSSRPRSKLAPALTARRRPRLPITQHGIAGLDLLNQRRDR
jgi:hypothetical protein